MPGNERPCRPEFPLGCGAVAGRSFAQNNRRLHLGVELSSFVSSNGGKTQIGNLMKKAEMKPFEEDLHEQMQSNWSAVADRLGIQLDDLRGVPTAEAALAMIRTTVQSTNGPEPGAATTLLMDVTGNANNAGVLKKARQGLTARQAEETILNVQGVQVHAFDVPLPAASRRRPRGAAQQRGSARGNKPDGLLPHRQRILRLR